MNRKRNKILRVSIILIMVVLLVAVLAVFSIQSEDKNAQFSVGENTDVMEFSPYIENESRLDNSLLAYGKVLNKYTTAGYEDYDGEDIVLPANSFISEDGTIKPFDEDFKDEDSGSLIKADPEAVITEGTVTLNYEFTVPETGLYNLKLDFFLPKQKMTEALLSVAVNGKKPFLESSLIELTRLYEQYDIDKLDDMGNEIKAKQREFFEWQSVSLGNAEGYYKDPYKILFQAGKTQTLTLVFSRQNVCVKSVSLVAPKLVPTYEEYRKLHNADDYTGETLPRIEVEETVSKKNDVGVTMAWDENYCSSPASYGDINYNIYGGGRWSEGAQSITFKTGEIPEDGWYQLSFRYMSPTADIVAFREIAIDGEVPFDEVKEYCFTAANDWVCLSLKDENQEPYMFYLTKGVHEITMTVKLGPFRHVAQNLTQTSSFLSSLLKKIVQVTGSARNSDGTYQVDKNRDWDLQLYIPSIKKDIETTRDTLVKSYERIVELNNGIVPYYASNVKVAADLFVKLAKDIEDVPAAINDINTYMANIEESVVNMKIQGLTLDYALLGKKDESYPDAISTFWQNLYVSAVRFGRSFTTDYASIGVVNEKDTENMPEITVYAAFGREQFEMLRNLVTEDFTANHNIKVNLTMVAGAEGLIMMRYVAGTAPDASVSFGGGSVVEYAMRGALYPLDTLPGFTDYLDIENNPLGAPDPLFGEDYEGAKNDQFIPASFISGHYRGHYYGFPETMSCSVLFFRTDIMDELGIDPYALDTWEDVYDILPILQENDMDFCYSFSVGGYWPILFQHGGDLWDTNGKKSALDTTEAFDAYIEFTNMYIKYKIPYAANFYQRFRNGDIPIGISNIGLYNQLKVAAPEILGKWAMKPLPGHYDPEYGIVRRDSGGAGGMSVIVDKVRGEGEEDESRFEHPSEEILNSWEFIQWWMSTEAQADFAQEVEIAYGVASRWTTANKYALATEPYTDEEMEVMQEQLRWLHEAHNVPGGYYEERYMLTALNKTVLQGENPRANLEDCIKATNKEMKRKQKEFGIGEHDSVIFAEWMDD